MLDRNVQKVHQCLCKCKRWWLSERRRRVCALCCRVQRICRKGSQPCGGCKQLVYSFACAGRRHRFQPWEHRAQRSCKSCLPLGLQRRCMQAAQAAAVAAGAVGLAAKLAVDTGSQAASHLLDMEGELLADTGQSFHHLQQQNSMCLSSKGNEQVVYRT